MGYKDVWGTVCMACHEILMEKGPHQHKFYERAHEWLMAVTEADGALFVEEDEESAWSEASAIADFEQMPRTDEGPNSDAMSGRRTQDVRDRVSYGGYHWDWKEWITRQYQTEESQRIAEAPPVGEEQHHATEDEQPAAKEQETGVQQRLQRAVERLQRTVCQR